MFMAAFDLPLFNWPFGTVIGARGVAILSAGAENIRLMFRSALTTDCGVHEAQVCNGRSGVMFSNAVISDKVLHKVYVSSV